MSMKAKEIESLSGLNVQKENLIIQLRAEHKSFETSQTEYKDQIFDLNAEITRLK